MRGCEFTHLLNPYDSSIFMQHLHQFLHLSDKGTSAVECMIPQIFNLRPHLLKSIVHGITWQTGSTLSIVYTRSDCHLTIYPLSIGLKLTMHCYKWSWLTVVELSIGRRIVSCVICWCATLCRLLPVMLANVRHPAWTSTMHGYCLQHRWSPETYTTNLNNKFLLYSILCQLVIRTR